MAGGQVAKPAISVSVNTSEAPPLNRLSSLYSERPPTPEKQSNSKVAGLTFFRFETE